MIRRLLTTVIFSLTAASVSLQAATPPNIVLIISDDHLWKDYSFMAHPVVKTPRLDRLAKESLTFTRGYVPSSLCCPSLATIITGLFPHQHKVASNDPPEVPGMKPRDRAKSHEFEAGREVMSKHLEDAGTLPAKLAKAGYLSLQTGKWWQKHYSRGGFTHGMTEGGRHGDKGLDIGRKTMQPVYDFISEAQREQKPFLVWYAPMMPHDPHTPPQRLLEKYRDKVPSLHVARYYAMVEWFDETCGQLLDHLDAKGLRENTIVVYVTDNGWITNPDTGRYADKSKHSQYDGGVRTPIMLRWPGKVSAKMSGELASSIDIAPTLLKAAGLEVAKEMQGIDLFDEKAVASRKVIHGECFTHSSMDLNVPAASLKWRWMIDGHNKLIIPDKKNQPEDVVELYDLKSDPDEMNNLASEKAGLVSAMTQKLDAWWKP